jgi:hypothetical protein
MINNGGNNEDNPAYVLTTQTASTISAEYKLYNFVVKNNQCEKRNIMVRGRIDTKADEGGKIINDIRVIWDDNEYGSTSSVVYINPPEKSENYYNMNTNEFVVPFTYQCTMPFNYPLTLLGGTDNGEPTEKRVCSATTSIHVVQDRKMKIHYNYMKSFDILNDNTVGDHVLDNFTNAFAEANTGIEVAKENKGEIANANLQIDDISWDEDLYNELINKKLIPSGNLMPDGTATPDASVWLIGLMGYSSTATQGSELAGGYTLRTTNTTGKLLAVTCIFVEKAKLQYPNDTEKQKKFVSVVTCHELGHARAIELTNEQTPFLFLDVFNGLTYGNLTSDDHTGGHNGLNKDTCVMSYGIPDKQIEKIHFCSGHLQMLFNCSSQDGGF